MFLANRFRNQYSNFFTCLVAGFFIGLNTSRIGKTFDTEGPNNLKYFVAGFMAFYAFHRFNGNFDQRLNRTIGTALGISLGMWTATQILFTNKPEEPCSLQLK